ncbi:MAG: Bug family tripartite tricarboxylate transporter substrate binding protein [Burkholderiales bacterium]
MHRLARIFLVFVIAVAPGIAIAQAFPSKALRLIVPFPAGGPADLFGRALAQGMSANLGQPVVIENRAGAGGLIGVDAAAKAAPDGYTLALNSASAVSIAPYSMDKMPFDPRKDLALITTVVRVPEVLIVHPSVPAKNLDELIAYAKANPNKINFASAGSGSITHLAVELLKVEAKIEMVHVPYKGAAPAVTDLLGGQVQMAILDVPVVLQHIRSGKLRAIVTASGQRASSLPDVPSSVEAKYPKVNSDNWYGLVAPSATSAVVLKRIHDAAMVALRSPEVIEQYAKVSAIAAPSTPEEYSAYLTTEQAKWGAVVKAIGFRATE